MSSTRSRSATDLAIAIGVAAVAVVVVVVMVLAQGPSRRSLIERMPATTSATALLETSYRAPDVLVVIAADGSLRVGRGPRRWSSLAGVPSRDGDATDLDHLAGALERARQRDHDPDQVRVDLASLDPYEPSDKPGLELAHPPVPGTTDRGAPSRLGEVGGGVRDSLPYSVPALVIAAPTARATVLIDVLARVGGVVAVARKGKVGALRVTFDRTPPATLWTDATPAPWAEVRFVTGGLELEGVPDQPTRVVWDGTGPLPLLAAAYDEARAHRGIGDRHDVDVLIAPDTTVQALVAVVVALTDAGAQAIALGRAPAPHSAEATRRGHRTPSVTAVKVAGDGPIDDVAIQRAIEERYPALLQCYQMARVDQPNLSGTVDATFDIEPDGRFTVEADGLTLDTGRCVTAALQSMILPGPPTVDAVRLDYQMTFGD